MAQIGLYVSAMDAWAEWHTAGHLYPDCPALRRGGSRPAEEVFPGSDRVLLRHLCKRCARRRNGFTLSKKANA